MNWLYVFIIPLLLNQSLGVNVNDLTRKQNMVSRFLNQILDKLSTEDFPLPEVDLEKYLKMTGLVGRIGYVSKEIDGVEAFGFKLNTTMKTLITGEYDLNLDIPDLFPIFGKGKLLLAAEELYINMRLEAKYDIVEEKFDVELPFFDVDVKNTTVKLENLMNDPHLADFLNELLSKLIPDFFAMVKPQLLEYAKPLIKDFGSGVLFCVKNKPLSVTKCIEDLFKTQYDDTTQLFSKLVNNLLRGSKIIK